jgi:hypothetical protein
MTIAYTIGHTVSYERYLKEDPNCMKVGRRDDYVGGCVWATQEEAQAFLDAGHLIIDSVVRDTSEFSVYGIHLPTGWDTDVSVETYDGVRALLNDAVLFKI